MGNIAKGKNGVEVSIGNHKIPVDTMILNMGAAFDCPSKALGLCQLPNPDDCYGKKAERQYPACKPYRYRQRDTWWNLSAAGIANDLVQIASRKRKVPIKYLRFSESGDLDSQDDCFGQCG